ncbi:MAG: Fis family transcriptional regulator [Candidatus Azotimanducaceae bacterium]|jgi:Fis family transcriptional regulator
MSEEYFVEDVRVIGESDGNVSVSIPSLSESVEAAVKKYINAMDGQEISNLYDLVVSEIEAPLLATVMKRTSRNQSRASSVLGLNRGTLRKKLKKYGLV